MTAWSEETKERARATRLNNRIVNSVEDCHEKPFPGVEQQVLSIGFQI